MEEHLEFGGTDRFEVISRLGEGGMGAVYHVADRLRGARLALKTLGKGKGDALWRFKNEFRALQEIDHENLVSLGELFEHEGQWFFTMELVTGVDLLSYVRTGPTPMAERAIDFDPTLPDIPQMAAGLIGDGILGEGALFEHPIANATVGFDEVRLRRALAQLATAVHTLHEHGHVHRDIKPANILIDDSERLVVIDFGLVADLHGQDPLGQLVGTAAFMAPEQATAATLSPAADWYAVGATLYEALTGRLPFDGPPVKVLNAKLRELPPSPASICSGVPDDLDALCMDLLRIEPSERPSGEAVLRRLHVARSPVSSPRLTTPRSSSGAGAFVGRERELGCLREAARRAHQRRDQVLMIVTGMSGMGKSTLVAQLDRDFRASDDALVLRGRCYEQESVPFKAFDGVMDQLSRWLRKQAPSEIARYLPADPGQLGEAFPVMRRVQAIDEGAVPESPEPLERRRLLFAAVRELFARLADAFDVVLTIDDIQWSDDASRQLLEALTRRPAPPPCLIVLTERTDEAHDSVTLPWFEDAEQLVISPLAHEDALALARAQLGPAAAPGGRLAGTLDALIAHAGGHPIFLETLIRHVGENEREALSMDFDGVLLQQLDRLDPASRSLLDVICLAGFPIDRTVAARAADVPLGSLPQKLRSLRVGRLVRAADASQQGAVEPYHGRIREAVLVVLEERARRAYHRELAFALEDERAAPERIAHHYVGGGLADQATTFLLRAAQRANQAYAFSQAAEFLSRALALESMDPPRTQAARLRLGHALANAGRAEEAARAYEAALAGASHEQRPDLKRRVAEQLLTAGLYREGLAAGLDVMNDLGIPFPTTSGAAFRRLAWLRIRLGIRGLGFTERSTADLSPAELARIDACWHLSRGFAAHDVILAQVLQSQALLYALQAGEPLRIAKGYCYEYLSRAIDGPESLLKERVLLEQARAIADASGDPNIAAAVAFAEGMGAHTAACHFTISAPRLEQASEILRDQCRDVAWEKSLIGEQRLLAYYWLGRWRDLARDCPDLCVRAEEVGNKYWVNRFSGSYLSFVAELNDDVVRSRHLVELGEAALPHDASAVQRFGQLWCATRLDLYEGRWQQAVERIDSWRADFLASFVLKVPLVAFTHQFDIGRVFAAAAANDGANRRAHLRRVRKAAKHLARVKVPFASGVADVLRGAASVIAGDIPAALDHLERAEPVLRRHGLLGVASAVQRRRAQLLGQPGEASLRAADRWFSEQGVRNPRSMTAMLIPM